jgi:hypothetical protein
LAAILRSRQKPRLLPAAIEAMSAEIASGAFKRSVQHHL